MQQINWRTKKTRLTSQFFSTIRHHFNGSSQKFQIFVIKSVFWQNKYLGTFQDLWDTSANLQKFLTLHNSLFYKLYPQFRYFLRTWSSSCNCNWHFDRWLITPTNISLVILFGTAKMNTMHRSFKVPTIVWVWLCYVLFSRD